MGVADCRLHSISSAAVTQRSATQPSVSSDAQLLGGCAEIREVRTRTFRYPILVWGCSSMSVITETNTSHGPCVQHVILRAALATPLSAHG